jgi:hypothetical protein
MDCEIWADKLRSQCHYESYILDLDRLGMSNKRTRERNEYAEIEPNSKRASNAHRQHAHESIGSTKQSQYADSGVNLTYAAGCTEEENYDTGTLYTYDIISKF